MEDREKKLSDLHKKIQSQYSDIDHFHAVLNSVNVGREIFSTEDLYIKNPLDRILRFFFIKKKITWKYLKVNTNNWYRSSITSSPVKSNIDSSKQNSNWSNIQKTVLGKKSIFGLTFRSLTQILSDILGWCVVDIKISFKHVSSKEELEISLSDIEEFLKQHKEGK